MSRLEAGRIVKPRRLGASLRAVGLTGCAGLLLFAPRAGAQTLTTPGVFRSATVLDVYSSLNISDARAAMDLWVDALTRDAGGRYRATSLLFETAEQAVAAARDGEIEGLSLSTTDYLLAREQVALEPAAVGMFAGGQVLEEFALLVRGDGDIGGLADLQGKKLLVNHLDWRVARLWLEVLLRREGMRGIDLHFGEVIPGKGPANQVLPVFFGQADACIVTARSLATQGELNPQLERELMVVARSPAFLLYLTCLVEGVDEELRRTFLDFCQKVHEDQAGRQILALFGVERIGLYRPEYLESVEQLMADYEALRGR